MLIQDIIWANISQLRFVCAGCGAEFQRGGPNQKRCRECASKINRDRLRARHARNLGSSGECCSCGQEFVITHGSLKKCDKCRTEERLRKDGRYRCATCGLKFAQSSNRQRHCAGCKIANVRRIRRASYERCKQGTAFKARRNKRSSERTVRLYRTDPRFNLNQRMRTALTRCLGSRKKGCRWESLVGYTITDLMAHLERQFLPGMSWENRGKWHIDHIRPLCSFEFETPDDPEFREAWALSNLRPLWARDNLRKGGRLEVLI